MYYEVLTQNYIMRAASSTADSVRKEVRHGQCRQPEIAGYCRAYQWHHVLIPMQVLTKTQPDSHTIYCIV
jgi:hypothetical protein